MGDRHLMSPTETPSDSDHKKKKKKKEEDPERKRKKKEKKKKKVRQGLVTTAHCVPQYLSPVLGGVLCLRLDPR